MTKRIKRFLAALLDALGHYEHERPLQPASLTYYPERPEMSE